MKIRKNVNLELADELWATESGLQLNERDLSKDEKKRAAAERKELKELRERYPIRIAISFKPPFWSYEGE